MCRGWRGGAVCRFPRPATSTRSTGAAASIRPRISRSRARKAGGYRGVFDLADPARSRFIIATGQSGHIFSRHYSDLLPLWREGRAITLSGDEKALQASGATLLTFAPE